MNEKNIILLSMNENSLSMSIQMKLCEGKKKKMKRFYHGLEHIQPHPICGPLSMSNIYT
jgi:hypothetical protein